MMEIHSTRKVLIEPALFLSNVANYLPSLVTSLLLVEISQSFMIDVGLAGQLRTAGFLCSIGFALLIGGLSVNYSHKLLLLIGIVFLNLSAVICYASPTFLFLLLGYSLVGVSLACIRPMGSALVGALFPVEQRPRVIGYLTVGGASAYLLGALFIGAIGDWRLAFVFLVLPLAIISLGLAIAGIPATTTTARSSLLRAFRAIVSHRSAIACLIGNVFAFITWSIFLSYTAAFYREVFRLEPAIVSYYFIGISIVYIIGGICVSRLVNRYGRKPLTVMTAFLNGVFLLISMNVASLTISLGFSHLTSFMSGVRVSAYNSLALEQVSEYRGTLMSLNQVSQDLGSMIGTGIGGVLLLLFEYSALSLLGFAALIASGIFYLFTIDPTCLGKAKHIPIVESHIVHHKSVGGEK